MPTPVLLEAAINGTTTKARNPNVPRTPGEITADALACIEAGASLVHNHTDDPIFDGVTAAHSPAPYIEAWRPVLDEHPDAGHRIGADGNIVLANETLDRHQREEVLRAQVVDPRVRSARGRDDVLTGLVVEVPEAHVIPP